MFKLTYKNKTSTEVLFKACRKFDEDSEKVIKQ